MVKIPKQILVKLFLGLFLASFAVFVRQWVLDNFLFDAPLEEGTRKEYIRHGGLLRSYIIHVSKNYKEDQSVPLVFVFHGAGGNADFTMESTELNKISDRENFIVVYPNGTGLFSKYVLSWNAGQCCNFVEPLGVDDVGFARVLLEKFQKDYSIKEDSIFATGLSNGAMMSYRLACEMADTFSAISPVAGSIMIDKCEPKDFVSVLAFHGKEDKVIPFVGGLSKDWLVETLGFEISFKSVPDSVRFWVKHNRCNKNPQKEKVGNVKKELYLEGRDNTEVGLYTILDAGHVWPGGKKVWFLSDPPSDELVASELIWQFFSSHTKI